MRPCNATEESGDLWFIYIAGNHRKVRSIHNKDGKSMDSDRMGKAEILLVDPGEEYEVFSFR